jgi:hypothetical protein
MTSEAGIEIRQVRRDDWEAREVAGWRFEPVFDANRPPEDRGNGRHRVATLLSARDDQGLRHIGEVDDSGDYHVWYVPRGMNDSPSSLRALPVDARAPSPDSYVIATVRVDVDSGTATMID